MSASLKRGIEFNSAHFLRADTGSIVDVFEWQVPEGGHGKSPARRDTVTRAIVVISVLSSLLYFDILTRVCDIYAICSARD